MGERARPLSEWTEEDGNVLWWQFPIEKPPYVGTPLDLGREALIDANIFMVGEEHSIEKRVHIGGWKDDYYTHWTPIPIPEEPSP